MCRRDFCDACLASPYHEGLSCEDNDRPDCLYCGEKVHMYCVYSKGVYYTYCWDRIHLARWGKPSRSRGTTGV